MALVPCPECLTQVSDKATACPKCGYPLSASQPPSGHTTQARDSGNAADLEGPSVYARRVGSASLLGEGPLLLKNGRLVVKGGAGELQLGSLADLQIARVMDAGGVQLHFGGSGGAWLIEDLAANTLVPFLKRLETRSVRKFTDWKVAQSSPLGGPTKSGGPHSGATGCGFGLALWAALALMMVFVPGPDSTSAFSRTIARWNAPSEAERGRTAAAAYQALLARKRETAETQRKKNLAAAVASGPKLLAGSSPCSQAAVPDLLYALQTARIDDSEATAAAALLAKFGPCLKKRERDAAIAAAKAAKVAEAEKKKAAIAAQAAARLGPKPDRYCPGQGLPTVGMVFGQRPPPCAVEIYLSKALHDPKSFEMEELCDVTPAKTSWLVTCQYRAKNAFGALRRQTTTFEMRGDQLIGVR